MRFHKEGRASIILAVLVSMALILAANQFFENDPRALGLAFVLSMILLIGILQFFRYPRRRMLTMDGSIIAPADGRVVVIEDTVDEEYFNGPVKQVSIFMSPLNVHINWFPISGEVVYSKYHPGKYLVAWHPKSSTENERHSVVIKTKEYGEILVKQIAGAMARRIVNYAKEGDVAAQSEEMGFIKFGSRVDLLIPTDANVEVKLEEKPIGGQTVIAHLKKQGA